MVSDEIGQMWEILVPYTSNAGVRYEHSHHQKWDREVQKIAGKDGITIQTRSKGKWTSPKNEVFEEKMIPVRLVATEE